MKYFELTNEEKQLLEEVEKGEYQSVSDLASEKVRYQEIAASTLNKTKNINIRLSEKDILKLKAKAVANGIPYQTLVSSILHIFANKKEEVSI